MAFPSLEASVPAIYNLLRQLLWEGVSLVALKYASQWLLRLTTLLMALPAW